MELSFDALRKTILPKIQYRAGIHQNFQSSVCKGIVFCCLILSLLYLNDIKLFHLLKSYLF